MTDTKLSSREWADEKNAEWSLLLRSSSLVAEVELDDLELERAKSLLAALLRQNVPETIGKHHPALLLVALTNIAMENWSQGSFYPNVAQALDISEEQAKRATKVYKSCLERFNLPTFSGIKALTWITPILIHSTVPLNDLGALIQLIRARQRISSALSGEDLVEWVRLHPARLSGYPKGIAHFLEHGGDFASDFVGRVMDLMRGEDVNLPRRVLATLREHIALQGGSNNSSREAPPSIGLSNDGDIVVKLPSVKPDELFTTEWVVRMGSHVVTKTAEVLNQSHRKLTTAHMISIPAPVREITVDHKDSSITLPLVRKEDALVVFDEDGNLVPATRGIPQGRVRALWPSTSTLLDRYNKPVEVLNFLDPPFGWSDWNLAEVKIPESGGISLPGGKVHRVAGHNQARIIATNAITGLFTEDGREVTEHRPQLLLPPDTHPNQWTIAVRNATGKLLEQFQALNHEPKVLEDTEKPFVGDLEITIRGPLGKGVVRKIAVAENVSIKFEPAHRTFAQDGGLQESQISIGVQGSVTSIKLDRTETRVPTTISDVPGFIIEPPHMSYALVAVDGQASWQTDPFDLLTENLSDTLRVRGYPDTLPAPRLVFRSGDTTQILNARGSRGRTFNFPLRSFEETIKSVGFGQFSLHGASLSTVGRIRPSRLVTSITPVGDDLLVESSISQQLELLMYRTAAPWEVPVVTPVREQAAALPATLRGRGPLRITARIRDEWFPEEPGPYPSTNTDFHHLDQPWDSQLEHSDSRVISEILLSESHPEISSPSIATIEFAIAALSDPTVLDSTKTNRLHSLIASHPQRTLRAIRNSKHDYQVMAAILVGSGLVERPLGHLSYTAIVEDLIDVNPLTALLAASNELQHSSTDSSIRLIIHETLGGEIDKLWRGLPDDYAIGIFEPSLSSMSRTQLDYIYRILNLVPSTLLDGDSIINASYSLWTSRHKLRELSGLSTQIISGVRNILRDYDIDLWPLVQGRFSQDGVLSLPGVSIALALSSRLAARGYVGAERLSRRYRPLFRELAIHAPSIVAIDIIRADAAIVGKTQ